VVVQGQPFAAGLVALVFTPEPHDNYYTNISLSTLTTLDPTNYLVRPHLILDPSKSDTYELELDCPTHVGYFGIKDQTYGSYIMDVIPITPIFSGTATAASMSVCTYVSLVEPEFHAMTLFSGELEKERKEGGVVSRALLSASHLTGVVGSVFPALSPYTTPFSMVSEGAGRLLSLFGFAKPSATNVNSIVLNRFVDNYSHFDGISTAPVLAGTAANSLSISGSAYGADPNDMLLRNIAAKKGYLKTVSIATTRVYGDLIHKMNVSPMICGTFGGGNTITPIAGVTRPFNFWAGDLTFTFEFIASVFHRCTVVIAYDPIANSIDPTLEQAVQTLQNTTVAISGNTSVEIVVPWSQPQPWLNTTNPLPAYVNGVNSLTNGVLYVFLVNPVTSNGSTDALACNMYIHSDNITWSMPEDVNLASYTFKTTLLSGELVPPTRVSFGPKTDLSLHPVRAFGEVYNSVKDVTSKLSPIGWQASAVLATSTNSWFVSGMPNLPITKTTAADVNPLFTQMNFHNWFAGAYVGYRGSSRYFFTMDKDLRANPVISSGKWFMRHFLYPTLYASGPGTSGASKQLSIAESYAYSYSNKTHCPNAEMTAPMQYPYDFVPMRRNVSAGRNIVEMGVDIIPGGDTTIDNFISTASGDDASYVRFVGWSAI